MSEKTIWEYLTKAGLTPAGAAGMMGNLYAESGLIAARVEILCLKRLREAGKIYTDATYTAFVDDGTITKAQFLNPLPGKQYGYGLAQWTTPTRKKGLYELCKKKKVSIGNEAAQLEYLMTELKKSFKGVYEVLKTTKDVRTASDIVLKQFEAPSDTGAAVQEARYRYAKKYYDAYVKTGVTADDILNIFRSWIGKNEADGSHREIIDLYNGHRPLARGYKVGYRDAWCATTVSAAFIKAGAVDLIGGTECGVGEQVALFKAAGIWKGRTTPKKGDIIVYDWQADGWQDHIGIVESVNGSTVTTIEGNYKDAVGRRKIAYNTASIAGYARPRYSAQNASKKPDTSSDSKSSTKLSEIPKWVGRVTAEALNVRAYAGKEYPNIKSRPYLYKGNLVDVCDSLKAADGKTWYFVRIDGSIFGFVSSSYLTRL